MMNAINAELYLVSALIQKREQGVSRMWFLGGWELTSAGSWCATY